MYPEWFIKKEIICTFCLGEDDWYFVRPPDPQQYVISNNPIDLDPKNPFKRQLLIRNYDLFSPYMNKYVIGNCYSMIHIDKTEKNKYKSFFAIYYYLPLCTRWHYANIGINFDFNFNKTFVYSVNDLCKSVVFALWILREKKINKHIAIYIIKKYLS